MAIPKISVIQINQYNLIHLNSPLPSRALPSAPPLVCFFSFPFLFSPFLFIFFLFTFEQLVKFIIYYLFLFPSLLSNSASFSLVTLVLSPAPPSHTFSHFLSHAFEPKIQFYLLFINST